MKRVYMVTVVDTKRILVVREEPVDCPTEGAVGAARLEALKMANGHGADLDTTMLVEHDQEASVVKLFP